MLLDFAVEGYIWAGRPRTLEAELARREAARQIEVDGERIGFRESAVVQANEPDAVAPCGDRGARLRADRAELEPALPRADRAASTSARGVLGYRELPRDVRGAARASTSRRSHGQTAAFTRRHRRRSTRACSSPSSSARSDSGWPSCAAPISRVSSARRSEDGALPGRPARCESLHRHAARARDRSRTEAERRTSTSSPRAEQVAAGVLRPGRAFRTRCIW